MHSLPAPDITKCYVDTSFEPHVPAMCLRWDTAAPGEAARRWYLPENLCLVGPPPERFSIHINRRDADAYAVRVLWNQTCLNWSHLTRVQLMTSALAPLLRAMGTDLWYLLDQPVQVQFTMPAAQAA